jgi:hypothetical protein
MYPYIEIVGAKLEEACLEEACLKNGVFFS